MQDYERYITVQEAAKRLNRPEPEIVRMLETGALPAMLRAELASKDGTPIGFDFARLPPEGVARVVDQGGDDFTLEWQYCGGHGKAVCFPARESSIRVLWEPSLFPKLMLPLEGAAYQATPVAGESSAPDAAIDCEKLKENTPQKRILASTLQDEAILAAIRKLGYDPMKVPKWEYNTKGVKAKVREMLIGKNQAFPKEGTQFKHAWDRLRERKEIATA